MVEGYIPKDKRKNILFLADDCRVPSGIGTMTREIMIGNAHRFNFVQVAAAIQHPEAGKAFDLSQDVNAIRGIDDSSLLLYPYNGYGDPDIVRMLIEKHQIDAIIHFTDPRYWIWLYRMSAEIRQRIPIFYYHIWDDLPAPHYNRPYYESCDLLMGISKQSDNIARLVLGEGNYIDIDSTYNEEDLSKPIPKTCFIPHGINHKDFFKLDATNKEDNTALTSMRKRLFGDADVDFVVMHNNRNIRRKMTSDVILAFKFFYDKTVAANNGDTTAADKMRLLLHTQPVDENGTDLYALIRDVCPEIAHLVVFTNARLTPGELNVLYNIADVVINIASNEGWGLSSTEALMTGTPVINNVTGGLQDQCRFEDEDGNWIKFDDKFASNHGGRFKNHGNWAKPVFPAAINLQGSIPTPYIFDDRCDIRDVADAMSYWYNTDPEQREAYGLEGRDWVMSDEARMSAESMCKSIGDAMSLVMTHWKPVPRFGIYNVHNETAKRKNKKTGISI
jgi:glycosyltransferase involved in cell wall biosynthesis